MVKLNLPEYQFRTRSTGKRTEIFDNLRKKFVALTPEEWVRQNFIQYLIVEKKVPQGLINVEMMLKYNQMTKRCDIAIYATTGTPVMIVECKAPHIEITQDVFDQIARYNMTLKVKYLVVTNGLKHFCCIIDFQNNNYKFIPELPLYQDF